MNLSPAVGTALSNNGAVTEHKATRAGLNVLTFEMQDAYPDVALWMKMIKGNVLMYNYEEKHQRGFFGILKIYWKEKKADAQRLESYQQTTAKTSR